jgi:hypothetical protein
MMMAKMLGGLGFRDLHLFNQDLLAKQAWRLIQCPGSLCAQLLKAKYYPRGDLVDTVFSADASPSWRSIVHGLELLKKGIIWRIGFKVQIWQDPWLPRPPTMSQERKNTNSMGVTAYETREARMG